MIQTEPSIKVEQYRARADGARFIYTYRVFEALNTTTPKVGEELDEDRLNELINVVGMRVTIRQPRG